MAYFGGSQNLRGDPGFFDSLFRGIKRGAKAAFGATPVGAAISAITSGPPRAPQPAFVPPALVGQASRRIPTVGRTSASRTVIDAQGFPVRRRRRMNAGNAKALRRAIRRTDAFVRLSRGALKNTGFKIVSKSAGKVSRATMDKAVAKAHHAK